MQRVLAATAAILTLAAGSAFAQSAGAPAIGATTGAAAPGVSSGMPTPPSMSASNPSTVNPMPEPGASPTGSAAAAGAIIRETPTGAPAADLGASATGAVNPPSLAATAPKSGYPVCKSHTQDSCRVGGRVAAKAR